MIRPLPILAGGIVDILMTLAVSAVLLVVFFYGRATMNRMIVATLLACYVGYMSLRAFS